MNAFLISTTYFMPCPARTLGLARSETQRASKTEMKPSAVRPAWIERMSFSGSLRRSAGFAGGLLIGTALWAIVFAASAATQFSA